MIGCKARAQVNCCVCVLFYSLVQTTAVLVARVFYFAQTNNKSANGSSNSNSSSRCERRLAGSLINATWPPAPQHFQPLAQRTSTCKTPRRRRCRRRLELLRKLRPRREANYHLELPAPKRVTRLRSHRRCKGLRRLLLCLWLPLRLLRCAATCTWPSRARARRLLAATRTFQVREY